MNSEILRLLRQRRGVIPALCLVVLAALLAVPSRAYAYDAASHACTAPAEDITTSCSVALRSQSGFSYSAADICDGNVRSGATASDGRFWQIDSADGTPDLGGIYLIWEHIPGTWRLTFSTDGVSFSDERLCGQNDFLEEYISLPDGVRSVRIEPLNGKLALLELSAWSRGRLPDSVHDWDLTPSECELMLISAHQDDELLFFGGMIPYYAGEKKLDTIVVYMADCGSLRLHEALDGLWTCGTRQYPVFLMLPDVKSQSLDQAIKTWDESGVTDTLAALFIRYRPQVVVSHDVNGEYGHGQHRMTAQCVRQALFRSEDIRESARISGGSDTYSVPKCYLHLWRRNEIFIDWNEIYLDSKHMTAAEAAALGYECHVSQQKSYDRIFINGVYDCRSFGLYRSNVGDDTGMNDLFENITPRIVNPSAPPEPPDGMERSSYSGFVYELPENGCYARFGSIGGNEDWFSCGADGALLYDAAGSAIRVFTEPEQPPKESPPSHSDISQEYMPSAAERLGAVLFPDGHISGYAAAAAVVLLFLIFLVLRRRRKNG